MERFLASGLINYIPFLLTVNGKTSVNKTRVMELIVIGAVAWSSMWVNMNGIQKDLDYLKVEMAEMRLDINIELDEIKLDLQRFRDDFYKPIK
jgi:hypothetical protein